MSRRLIFLMPNIDSNIFSAKTLLYRQDLYASYYKMLLGSSYAKGIVLYSGQESLGEGIRLDNLDIRNISSSSNNLLVYILKSLRFLRSLGETNLILVAGTPFQPFLAAIVIKRLLRKCKIQLSIHGELPGVRSSRLKSWFFGSQIYKADAIRFVSEAQMEVFEKEYGLRGVPKSVTPVPIEFLARDIKIKTINSIGFVGRIHAEREPLLWAAIVKDFPNLEKIIVGDGPLRTSLKEVLPSATYLGQFENEELLKVWSEIGILLSTAPFESYGLAIREALLGGVPVVAKESAGVKQLTTNFPNLIKTYTTVDEACRQISSFISKQPTSEEFLSFRNWFISTQETSLNELAKLWKSISD